MDAFADEDDDSAVLTSVDYVVDAVLDRLIRAVQEPLRLRRAITRLRGPSHWMYCAISEPPTVGDEYNWRSGLAMLGPGQIRFVESLGSQSGSSFNVRSVIETRETRQRHDGGPGPRQRSVAKLEVASGYLYWSAHPTLLAEGSAIVLARPRSAD